MVTFHVPKKALSHRYQNESLYPKLLPGQVYIVKSSLQRPRCGISETLYTLCVMPRSRLGPGNEYLLNEVGKFILISKFVFVLVNTTKNQNIFNVSELYASKRGCQYRFWPTDLVLMWPRFDVASFWKALCIVCVVKNSSRKACAPTLQRVIFESLNWSPRNRTCRRC